MKNSNWIQIVGFSTFCLGMLSRLVSKFFINYDFSRIIEGGGILIWIGAVVWFVGYFRKSDQTK